MDTEVPEGTAALPWLVFPSYLSKRGCNKFLLTREQNRSPCWPHDPPSLQGSALLTSCAQVFWPTDMENKISLKSAISRGRTKGENCPPTHTRQHTSEWGSIFSSLTSVEGAHTPARLWGGFHPDKQTPPVTQPADQPVAAEMPSNVLHTTSAETQSWGQSHKEGGETLFTDDTRNKCPRDGKASLWPNCKRMGREVQKWVREDKV